MESAGGLPQIDEYIQKMSENGAARQEARFRNLTRLIRRFRPLDEATKMLEIGPGTGSFPLLCAAHGLHCRGLEISPQLVEYGREMGRRQGIELDLEVGNIEDADLGRERYDVVIAWSVFEHVQRWRDGMQRIYNSLKPGGLLLFASSNKFTLKPIEFPFPFYEWLPDAWRYRLRIWRQGAEIMKLGIDFNQFTHPQLRRVFREMGYSRVFDRFDMADPETMASPMKKTIGRLAQRHALVKFPLLTFADATVFACLK